MEQSPETGPEALINFVADHPLLVGLVVIAVGLVGIKGRDVLEGLNQGIGGISGRKYDN